MPSSTAQDQKQSLGHRLRERLSRFRNRSRSPLNDARNNPDSLVANQSSVSQNALSPSSLSLGQTPNARQASRPFDNDAAQAQLDNSSAVSVYQGSTLEQDSPVNRSTPTYDIVIVSSDMWSAAYREAVDSLGKDINVTILKGENVAHLFAQLEELDQEATKESAFRKGVKYLHSLQVPLEKFKLALDLASPLSNIEPTAATVFGVVRSVTAIAISFSTADYEFAKQIGEMLKQISYIDDCDTLGRKSDSTDIHKALVLVYRNLLEFYNAAFEVLTKKGAKLVMEMILENGKLPKIVEGFLKHAEDLHKLVQKATWEIVEDMKLMLYDQEISRWLGSGKMTRQSQYHAYLQDLRDDQPCEFLLADAKFLSWYAASDSQQLVILGDLGHGKTVLMAFLVDELRRRNEHQLPQPKMCYHYCQDDETGHAICIFSVLILSLLEQLSGLKKTFFDWYKQAAAFGNFEPATSIKKLEEFLVMAFETLDRPLYILIDGLDECDRASQKTIIKSLKIWSQKTPRLKIILSSRPQEEILDQLSEMPKIDIASNAVRDNLIVEKTVETRLSHLSKDAKAMIVETLSRLAQGSAIWTKMIVELIEVRGIKSLNPMRTFLENMPQPGQLSELYDSILSRRTSNDVENQKLAMTALQILAIARRQLSIVEFAWAVALGAAGKEVTTIAALERTVDHQRVLSLIQPFIARVDFRNLKKRQIRLVHQSVKEFIVKKLGDGLDQAGTTRTDQADNDWCIQRLEAMILEICIKYLLLEDFNHIELFSQTQRAIDELPQEVDLFNDNDGPNDFTVLCSWEVWEENMIRYDPTERGFGEFFVYASAYWLDHLGAVVVWPLPDLQKIGLLCQAHSLRMDNWTKQHVRPDCVLKARFSFESSLYDPLSITLLYGSQAILQSMLDNSDFGQDMYLPDTSMRAADQVLQWGDVSRLRVLFLNSKIGYQLRNLDFFELVMKRWCHSRQKWDTSQNWDAVFDLVNEITDVLVREHWGNELLCSAARKGCMSMVKKLMEMARQKSELRIELLRGDQRKLRHRSSGKPMQQPIGEAVLGNQVEVVKYLLAQDAMKEHLEYNDAELENVLYLASQHCNPIMFQLLLPHFKKGARHSDYQRDTALIRIITSPAVPKDRYESARLLLESEIDPPDHDEDEQHEPLRLAVRLGDLDMCGLLINVGKMDPLSAMKYDEQGRAILKEETDENEYVRSDILHLLRKQLANNRSPRLART